MKPPRIIILGAGGHGRAVAEAARDAGWEVLGFADARAPLPAQLGLPVLGGEEAIAGAAVIAIGDNAQRLAAAARLRARGIALPALIHPTAHLARSATVGEGAVVMPRAVLGALARIGPLALVNTAAVVEHDAEVEEGAHVAIGALLCGGARVRRGGLVGAGAVVLPGVEVVGVVVAGRGAAPPRPSPPGTFCPRTPR